VEKNGTARISIKLTPNRRENPKQQMMPKETASIPSVPKEPELPAVASNKEIVLPEPLLREESAIDRLQEIRNRHDGGVYLDPEVEKKGEAQLWLLEEAGQDSEAPTIDLLHLPSRRKSRSTFLNSRPFTWLISTVSAIVIGLIFGFLVLAVFTQGQLNESYRSVVGETFQTAIPASEATQETDVADSTATENQAEHAQTGSVTPMSLQLPETRLYMAQVGAFTDKESAQIAIDSLVKKGYPHFLHEEAGTYYLFTATTSNRDDILGLASSFKGNGMDVYVKEVTLPGLQKMIELRNAASSTGSVDQTKIGAFFEAGMHLSNIMTNWTGRFLSAPSATKLTAEDEQAIKESHRKFLDASTAIQTAAPEAWQTHLTGMINGLNQAVAAINQTKAAVAEGKQGNAQSHAWQVQTGAISYLEHYALWVKEQLP